MLGEINKNYLLQVKNLNKVFEIRDAALRKRTIKAVDGVSFVINNKETFAIVGESGSGKSTIGRILLGLTDKTEGEIFFDGKPLQIQNHKNSIPLRRRIQIVFQDPYASLNPRMTCAQIIGEPLKVHQIVSTKREYEIRIKELFDLVGLNYSMANRYPHEFSGGQRQRLGIARALALSPKFIVCDESVSALDVSVQAQVLNLLNDLKKQFHFTYIFISHDLSVVKYMSDRLLVMRNGKIEESGIAEDIYLNPKSAYTKELIDAIPQVKSFSQA